jgi:hypothetical protein
LEKTFDLAAKAFGSSAAHLADGVVTTFFNVLPATTLRDSTSEHLFGRAIDAIKPQGQKTQLMGQHRIVRDSV